MVWQSALEGRKRHVLLFTVVMIVACCGDLSWAAPPYQSAVPFGGYAKGGRCGYYGARANVKNQGQAITTVKVLLDGSSWEIEGIEERPRYFKVHLRDSQTGQQQMVIIDKSTGRVRPIN